MSVSNLLCALRTVERDLGHGTQSQRPLAVGRECLQRLRSPQQEEDLDDLVSARWDLEQLARRLAQQELRGPSGVARLLAKAAAISKLMPRAPATRHVGTEAIAVLMGAAGPQVDGAVAIEKRVRGRMLKAHVARLTSCATCVGCSLSSTNAKISGSCLHV